MVDVLVEAVIDSIKLYPILLLVYLFVEFLQHKREDAFNRLLLKSKHTGPVYGALLGCFPQCGFSAAIADLYSRRIVTSGTLLAVFLATSDEALPILLANIGQMGTVVRLLIIKLVAGVLFGYAIDFALSKKRGVQKDAQAVSPLHSHGEYRFISLFSEALWRSFVIFLYIFIINMLLGLLIYFVGEDAFKGFLLSGSLLQPFIAALVGLIPNCAISVFIVQLYLEGSLSFAAMVAGLCSGAGAGLLVLLRANKNIKENLYIILALYIASAVVGFIVHLFC